MVLNVKASPFAGEARASMRTTLTAAARTAVWRMSQYHQPVLAAIRRSQYWRNYARPPHASVQQKPADMPSLGGTSSGFP
jgi:hypothetical protein